MIALLLLASYLIGAIPFGLLFSKMAGKDVRTEGSKNIGATNVSRVLGKKLGVLTLICDSVKAFLPMVLVSAILPETQSERELYIIVSGFLAVVGHIFPVYLRFQGGKGVASALGMFLYLSPYSVLISLGIFLLAVMVTGYVSIGSLLASGLIPIWLWTLHEPPAEIISGCLIALLIWYKHRANIRRLIAGEEKTWKKTKETL